MCVFKTFRGDLKFLSNELVGRGGVRRRLVAGGQGEVEGEGEAEVGRRWARGGRRRRQEVVAGRETDL